MPLIIEKAGFLLAGLSATVQLLVKLVCSRTVRVHQDRVRQQHAGPRAGRHGDAVLRTPRRCGRRCSGVRQALLTARNSSQQPRKEHLSSFYSGMADLFDGRFDGAIITGTEPRQPNLKQEPYWDTLASILDWAERNTASTVLSCLAAHAGVLHSDGISRRPLPDKQFGVFDFRKTSEHALTNRTPDVLRFPHSRWNEAPADALASCGYTLLTESTDAGVDLFVKKKKRSLFVHFQGHPEYGALTLLKEYRRDIRRFLCKKRNVSNDAAWIFRHRRGKLLNGFREHAMAQQDEKAMTAFPEAAVVGTLQKHLPSANWVYGNWLQYVESTELGK